MTKKINVFDQTVRMIRCTARVYDFLGDGNITVEEDLHVGMIYTYTHGWITSYGERVYLRESSNRWGYPAYLFEELKPYDEDAYVRRQKERFVEKLSQTHIADEERKRRTAKVSQEEKERIRERIQKLMSEPNMFDPDYIEGHDYGAAYWIFPAIIRDCRHVDFNDIQVVRDQEISVLQKYFDPFLTDFFVEGIDSELPCNSNRVSTDVVPDGIPIYGFQWYLHPNYYTYAQMEQILRQIDKMAEHLLNGSIYPCLERQKRRMQLAFADAVEQTSPRITYEDAMKTAAGFFQRLSSRIRVMMEACSQTNIICVMTP